MVRSSPKFTLWREVLVVDFPVAAAPAATIITWRWIRGTRKDSQ